MRCWWWRRNDPGSWRHSFVPSDPKSWWPSPLFPCQRWDRQDGIGRRWELMTEQFIQQQF